MTYRQALAAAGRGGEVLFLGNISGTLEVEKNEISAVLRKELILHGSWNSSFEPRGRDDWSVSLEAMGKDVDVEVLISHRAPLGDAPRIFEGIHNRDGFYNKVILHPGDRE